MTSMPNSVESLEYIKCYSSSSPRHVKSTSNSTRYNCTKICSWLKRSKTIPEVRKKDNISLGDQQFYYSQLFKHFTNHRKKTNRIVVFSCRPFPNILKYRDNRWDLLTVWKTKSLQTLIEEFNHSSGLQFFRTVTGVQSGPDAFDKSKFIMTFVTILGVKKILCRFRLVLEGKTGNEVPESSRLEFLENFSAKNFALLDADDNTSAPLNRGGIADLPLLRTLLAICQKSQEPRFWEVMD